MEIDEEIAFALGIEVARIREIAEAIELAGPVDKFLLLSTAMLLQILELHFAQEVKTWKNTVKKREDMMVWVGDFVLKTLQVIY